MIGFSSNFVFRFFQLLKFNIFLQTSISSDIFKINHPNSNKIKPPIFSYNLSSFQVLRTFEKSILNLKKNKEKLGEYEQNYLIFFSKFNFRRISNFQLQFNNSGEPTLHFYNFNFLNIILKSSSILSTRYCFSIEKIASSSKMPSTSISSDLQSSLDVQ